LNSNQHTVDWYTLILSTYKNQSNKQPNPICSVTSGSMWFTHYSRLASFYATRNPPHSNLVGGIPC